MSYRQQEENEEQQAHLAVINAKFDQGDYYEEYSDWLMHEHNLSPPICNGDTLIYHYENCTRSDEFIYEMAFGKSKMQQAMNSISATQ